MVDMGILRRTLIQGIRDGFKKHTNQDPDEYPGYEETGMDRISWAHLEITEKCKIWGEILRQERELEEAANHEPTRI